ncbi:MAG: hypothetical protein Q9M24_07250 [Mariprofundaceae bacterium]|nr:hypothetical protein [Mariprofundaceae bacterium]
MHDVVMLPIKWLKLKAWCAITGYTEDAFHGKKSRGEWLEGVHWKKAPDGNIFISWQEIDRWVETEQESRYGASASRLHSCSGGYSAANR